jgi:hypothetical protein
LKEPALSALSPSSVHLPLVPYPFALFYLISFLFALVNIVSSAAELFFQHCDRSSHDRLRVDEFLHDLFLGLVLTGIWTSVFNNTSAVWLSGKTFLVSISPVAVGITYLHSIQFA